MSITRAIRRIVRYLSLLSLFVVHLLCSCRRERIRRRLSSRWNETIFVCQSGSKRRMRFGSLFSGSQSEVDLNDVHRPSDEYIQLLIFASSKDDDEKEKDFLCFGLGGGVLPRALRRLHPGASIEIVELDPVVVQLAKEEFFFEEDERMRVIITDAQRYIPKKRFSSIFVDVYDGRNEMPVQMQSEAFLRSLLDHSDLLIFNLLTYNPSLKDFLQLIETIFTASPLRYFQTRDSFNVVLLVGGDVQRVSVDLREKLHLDVDQLSRREVSFSALFL